MSKIKIIYLYSKMVSDEEREKVFFAGGAQKRVYQMAVYFTKHFDVFVGSQDESDSLIIKDFQKKEITHISLIFRGNLVQSLVSIYKLIRVVKEKKINIIHCNDRKTLLFAYIVTRFTKAKMIYTARSTYKDKKYTRSFYGNNIVAVSKGVKSNLVQDFKINSEYISIIYNGSDITHASIQDVNDIFTRYNLKENNRIITFVGRLTELKGLLFLLDAVKIVKESFPSVVVLLVGDGELRQSIENKMKELTIEDNIVLCGYYTNIQAFYDIGEFTVLPSLFEGLGVSAIESIMLGKPVVATNVGGIPEVIQNGRNGFLIPPRNSKLLAEKINYLLSNPNCTKLMSSECMRIAKDKFTLTQMMDTYYDYYKNII